MIFSCTLDVVPMPTTNMNMIITNPKTKRHMVIKTKDARAWMDEAVMKLQVFKGRARLVTIEYPVALSMYVYRPRNAGDLGNYYKGLEDALEAAGIVRNDKLITQHRDCRALTDPNRPRYEIALYALEGGSEPLFPLT